MVSHHALGAETAMPLWVIKLGGSLATSPQLQDWLGVLTVASGQVVVVPGGGPFADAVRSSQRRWRFSDPTAHHMALLAMHQYGLMLCDLSERLVPATSELTIRSTLAAGLRPVWLPAPMTSSAAELETSWRLTSDSLAMWLARLLNASYLVLVKSSDIPDDASVEALAESGIVDPLFPRYARGCDCAIVCLGPDEPKRLAHALALGEFPGTPLAPEN